MNFFSLIKNQTAARLVLFTLVSFVASVGLAQGTSQPAYTAPDPLRQLYTVNCVPNPNTENGYTDQTCRDLRNQLGLTANTGGCDTLLAQIDENAAKLNQCNSTCRQMILNCENADEEAGGNMVNTMFNMGSCTQLNSSGCSIRNAGTAQTMRQEKKDAEQRKKDAQEQLIEAQNDQQQAQVDFRKEMQELRKTADEAQRTHRDNMKNALRQLQAELEGQDSQVQKARDSLEEQYDKWNQEYIKMRDALRTANDAVLNAEMAMDEACTGEADAKYRAAEAKLMERMEKETNTVKNVSMATAAGYYKRKVRRLKKDMKKNWAGFMAECMNGVSPAGKKAKNDITRSKLEATRLRARLNDEEARIEQLRQQVMTRYAELQKQVEQNKIKIQTQMEEDMKNMQTDHQQLITRANEEQQLVTQEYSNKMQYLQQRMILAGNEMNEASNEVYLSGMRLNCAQMNGGSMTEANADRTETRMNEAASAFSNLRSQCNRAKSLASSCSFNFPTSSRATASRPSPGTATAQGSTSTGTQVNPVCADATSASTSTVYDYFEGAR